LHGSSDVCGGGNSNLNRICDGFCMLCIPVSMSSILFTVSRAGIQIFAFLVTLGTRHFVILGNECQKICIAMVVCLFSESSTLQSWTVEARSGRSTLADEYTGDQVESRAILRQPRSFG